MSAEQKDKCAVVGYEGFSEDAARISYEAQRVLQHRGQDSSGMAIWTEGGLRVLKGEGLVKNVFDYQEILSIKGRRAIGHNRYATSGGLGFEHCQPIILGGGELVLAHNGNIPKLENYRQKLFSRGISSEGKNDSEMMAELIFGEWRDGNNLIRAVGNVLEITEGAVSAVIQTPEETIAFRDRWGIRPLVMGRTQDGGVLFASETVALDQIGAKFIRDVENGEIVRVQRHRERLVIDSSYVKNRSMDEQIDIFEPTYFESRLSRLDGRLVADLRKEMGRKLAMEHQIEADIVVGAPESALDAARGYAEISGIPFVNALLKNPDSARTFIQASEEERVRAAWEKYIPVSELVKEKHVIVVDDSIVRSLTAQVITAKLRHAGATKVSFLAHSPEYSYSDMLGIDTQDLSQLVAYNRSHAEIRDVIGADFVGYLSLDGLINATGRDKARFTTHVFSGEYPFEITRGDLVLV